MLEDVIFLNIDNIVPSWDTYCFTLDIHSPGHKLKNGKDEEDNSPLAEEGTVAEASEDDKELVVPVLIPLHLENPNPDPGNPTAPWHYYMRPIDETHLSAKAEKRYAEEELQERTKFRGTQLWDALHCLDKSHGGRHNAQGGKNCLPVMSRKGKCWTLMSILKKKSYPHHIFISVVTFLLARKVMLHGCIDKAEVFLRLDRCLNSERRDLGSLLSLNPEASEDGTLLVIFRDDGIHAPCNDSTGLGEATF
ncbi:hypothetical protein EV424DRAFT_1350323 [Suillus variegatus]|nr:hypothetical protein EV424DRAFT_1350323 [Suillus variegatus]